MVCGMRRERERERWRVIREWCEGDLMAVCGDQVQVLSSLFFFLFFSFFWSLLSPHPLISLSLMPQTCFKIISRGIWGEKQKSRKILSLTLHPHSLRKSPAGREILFSSDGQAPASGHLEQNRPAGLSPSLSSPQSSYWLFLRLGSSLSFSLLSDHQTGLWCCNPCRWTGQDWLDPLFF